MKNFLRKGFKFVLYFAVTLVLGIILGSTVYYDMLYYHVNKAEKTQLKQVDAQPFYYAINPSSKDRHIQLDEGKKNYAIDLNSDQQINSLTSVDQVYPFSSLYFLNYQFKNENQEWVNCNQTLIKTDNDNYSIKYEEDIHRDSTYVILPYFKEDGLDNHLEKIFITTECSYLLGVENGEVTLSDVAIPVSQNDSNEILYKQVDLTLNMDEVIDYKSYLYDTKQVILVPYPKMQSLLNEYQNKDDPYQPSLRVVYGNNQTIMKQEILNVDDHITYLSSYEQVQNRFGQLKHNLTTSVFYLLNVGTVLMSIGFILLAKKFGLNVFENFPAFPLFAGSTVASDGFPHLIPIDILDYFLYESYFKDAFIIVIYIVCMYWCINKMKSKTNKKLS